jgi:hypothetical protein
LIKAVEKGDIVTVRSMLARGTNVQVRDSRGRALMYAASTAMLSRQTPSSAAPMSMPACHGLDGLMLAAGAVTRHCQALLSHKRM